MTDQKKFDAGLAARKKVLGAEYVERSLTNATPFSQQFQTMVTEFCWGEAWGDDTLNYKERSMLNLGMLAALGRFTEFKLHFKGAITNGLSEDQLRAILIQIAIYCGIPVGVEAFRIANEVLAEQKKAAE